LLGLLPLLYLARGGIVFDFYILAALPFLCLNVAVLLTPLIERLGVRGSAVAALGIGAGLLVGYVYNGALQPLYTQTPSTAGREAIAWIKASLPADAFIIARDDVWTDLREPGSGGVGFANVHSYTKVAGDPAIRSAVFADDWRTVDYLVTSPGLEQVLADSGNTIALQALQHAHLEKTWTADNSTLELRKVDKSGATEERLLRASAAFISRHFDRGGFFTTGDGSVTSEAQAYALLRAAWSGDRESFDRTWRWSRAHLMNANGLLAWKWKGDIVDNHSAADADADTALALLMAGRRWANPDWIDDGTRMAQSIWEHDVAHTGQASYLGAGDWASAPDVLVVNPSYFAPYAYHVFKEVDPEHDWLGLIDSGYQLLFNSSTALLGGEHSSGLPPDWIEIDRESGRIGPVRVGAPEQTTDYGYDAPRAYWRVALDLRWYGDGRAAAYLAQAGFLRDEVTRSGAVRAVYSHDGNVDREETSVVGNAGALAALLQLDADAANRLYAANLLGSAAFSGGEAHWSDGGDLYAQEWGWFATGLYANKLTDIWHETPRTED
jgi:endoglucanase